MLGPFEEIEIRYEKLKQNVDLRFRLTGFVVLDLLLLNCILAIGLSTAINDLLRALFCLLLLPLATVVLYFIITLTKELKIIRNSGAEK